MSLMYIVNMMVSLVDDLYIYYKSLFTLDLLYVFYKGAFFSFVVILTVFLWKKLYVLFFHFVFEFFVNVLSMFVF